MPIDERRLCLALGLVAVVLSVIGAVTNLAYAATDHGPDRVQRFLDVNGEGNLPTWYSVVLMAAAASAVAFVAGHHRRAGHRDASAWYLLAGVVALMSLDEMVSLHEAAGHVIDDRVDVAVVGKYAWILPGTIATLVAMRILLRAVYALPRRSRRQLVGAGAVFIGAALGIEVLEALLLNDGRNYLGGGMHVLTATQECLEMIGVILFLRAMLDELRRLGGPG